MERYPCPQCHRPRSSSGPFGALGFCCEHPALSAGVVSRRGVGALGTVQKAVFCRAGQAWWRPAVEPEPARRQQDLTLYRVETIVPAERSATPQGIKA